jgi:hypothetical protein
MRFWSYATSDLAPECGLEDQAELEVYRPPALGISNSVEKYVE